MDDFTIADLGYVWGRVIYDDDETYTVVQMTRKNRVKLAASRMGTFAREHIDEPIETIMNYDY